MRSEVSVDGDGAGGDTVVRLRNTAPDPAWAPNVALGWDACLGNLERVLAGLPPVDTPRPTDADVEALRRQLARDFPPR